MKGRLLQYKDLPTDSRRSQQYTSWSHISANTNVQKYHNSSALQTVIRFTSLLSLAAELNGCY